MQFALCSRTLVPAYPDLEAPHFDTCTRSRGSRLTETEHLLMLYVLLQPAWPGVLLVQQGPLKGDAKHGTQLGMVADVRVEQQGPFHHGPYYR